jgi:gliding motility-associated-like protein
LRFVLRKYLIITFLFAAQIIFAQTPCVRIEHVLVDACGFPEAANEMLRFRVGNNSLSVNNMTVNWPSPLNFTGICQNENTTALTEALNAQIENCGLLVEPENGVLPPGANVLFILGENFDINAHSFANLAEQLYVIYQCGTKPPGGHLGNWNPTAPPSTVTISFGIGCNDFLTYNRQLLVTQNGTQGAEDGAFVRRNPNGPGLVYGNDGCTPPFDQPNPFWSIEPFICENSDEIDLQSLVTGYPFGAFSGPFVSDGIFNPEDISGEFPITYTIDPSGTGDCVFDSTITVTVLPELNPSWNADPIACSQTGLFDLNQRILGDEGGFFSSPSGLVENNQLNLDDLTAPIFVIYTVGQSPCTYSESAFIGFFENPEPPALQLEAAGCENEVSALLTAVSENTVKWYQDINLEELVFTGLTFEPGVLSGSTTYYAVSEFNDCFSDPVEILAEVNPIPAEPEVENLFQFCEGQDFYLLTAETEFEAHWFSPDNNLTPVFIGNNWENSTVQSGDVFLVYQVNGLCFSEPIETTVELLSQPPPPEIEPFELPCLNDAVTLEANSNFPIFWFASPNLDDELAAGSSFTTGNITEPTTYYTAALLNDCYSNFFPVTVEPSGVTPPQISEQGTIELCNQLGLDVLVDNANDVFWSNGSTENQVSLNQSGQYFVSASNECFTEEFEIDLTLRFLSASINQNQFEALPPLAVTFNATFLGDGADISYQWFSEPEMVFGQNTAVNQTFFEVGTYEIFLAVVNEFGCTDTVSTFVRVLPESSQEIYIPTAFTPNNDGVNDVFFIQGFGFNTFSLKIFDRWGNMVFFTENPNEGWDGTFRGEALPSGYYAFSLQILGAEPKFIDKKGSVLLLR